MVSFIRKAADGEYVICIINFSPVERLKYVMGVPENVTYRTDLYSALKSTAVKRNVVPRSDQAQSPRTAIRILSKSIFPKLGYVLKPEYKEEK